MNDGIGGMVSRQQMCEGARRYWDFYTMRPGAGFYQKEFGFYVFNRWQEEEHLSVTEDIDTLFGFDTPGIPPLALS